MLHQLDHTPLSHPYFKANYNVLLTALYIFLLVILYKINHILVVMASLLLLELTMHLPLFLYLRLIYHISIIIMIAIYKNSTVQRFIMFTTMMNLIAVDDHLFNCNHSVYIPFIFNRGIWDCLQGSLQQA